MRNTDRIFVQEADDFKIGDLLLRLRRIRFPFQKYGGLATRTMIHNAYSEGCMLHRLSWVSTLTLWIFSGLAFSAVVINEIHYNGEPNTAVNEFVELPNTDAKSVD